MRRILRSARGDRLWDAAALGAIEPASGDPGAQRETQRGEQERKPGPMLAQPREQVRREIGRRREQDRDHADGQGTEREHRAPGPHPHGEPCGAVTA